MAAPGKFPLIVVDTLGAGIFGACVITCAYLVFFHSEHANEEVREFTALISSGAQDLAAIRDALGRQRTLVRERHAELESRGQLPAMVPLEEYLQTLSVLAARNELRVIRQSPLSRREYPGLVEQLYAYDVAGAMPNLARFFKDVEDAELWADVAYLKIEKLPEQPGRAAGERLAALTVSLFSAPKQPVGGPSSGG